MPRVGHLNIPPYEITKRTASADGLITLGKNAFRELVRVTREGFDKDMSEQEIREVVLPNTELFIAYKNNKPVGFTAAKHRENEVYLAAAVIIPSERGTGLYTIFNRLRIEEGLSKGFTIISTRTQNPIVERRITSVLENLKMESKIIGYTVNRELLIGVYGRMLTGSRPESSDTNVNETFSRLNYEQGDAFFITFTVEHN